MLTAFILIPVANPICNKEHLSLWDLLVISVFSKETNVWLMYKVVFN